jgi:hypothetical protein
MVNKILNFIDSVLWEGLHERTILPETIAVLDE